MFSILDHSTRNAKRRFEPAENLREPKTWGDSKWVSEIKKIPRSLGNGELQSKWSNSCLDSVRKLIQDFGLGNSKPSTFIRTT